MPHPIPKAAEGDCSFPRSKLAGWRYRDGPLQGRIDAGIERVRVLVEPYVQFFQLLRRQRADGAFDFLDGV
jgi:hypothetical protein